MQLKMQNQLKLIKKNVSFDVGKMIQIGDLIMTRDDGLTCSGFLEFI